MLNILLGHTYNFNNGLEILKNLRIGGRKQQQWAYKPIYTTDSLIPQNWLEFISCKCESGCNTMICSCRKHGLHSSDGCSNCHGQSFSNIAEILAEEDSLKEGERLTDDMHDENDDECE